MSKKNGAYYGTRPLPGGKFGILVKTYIKGEWITTNQNTMPWPTEATALARAKADAGMEGEREGIENFPVIAMKKELA